MYGIFSLVQIDVLSEFTEYLSLSTNLPCLECKMTSIPGTKAEIKKKEDGKFNHKLSTLSGFHGRKEGKRNGVLVMIRSQGNTTKSSLLFIKSER